MIQSGAQIMPHEKMLINGSQTGIIKKMAGGKKKYNLRGQDDRIPKYNKAAA